MKFMLSFPQDIIYVYTENQQENRMHTGTCTSTHMTDSSSRTDYRSWLKIMHTWLLSDWQERVIHLCPACIVKRNSLSATYTQTCALAKRKVWGLIKVMQWSACRWLLPLNRLPVVVPQNSPLSHSKWTYGEH